MNRGAGIVFTILNIVSHDRIYVIARRAETHERFYMIEVRRHRFAWLARKVPFEKCKHWRKVCGRSAKDQIGDSIYFIIKLCKQGKEEILPAERKVRERRAKDARKTYPLEPCLAQNGLHLAMPNVMREKWNWKHRFWSKGKETTYHNDILVASIHSCRQQPIYCVVCLRVCLIWYIWFLIRILDFGKCNPYGAAKGSERFAKDLRKGVPGNFHVAHFAMYIYIYLRATAHAADP